MQEPQFAFNIECYSNRVRLVYDSPLKEQVPVVESKDCYRPRREFDVFGDIEVTDPEKVKADLKECFKDWYREGTGRIVGDRIRATTIFLETVLKNMQS